MCCYAQQYDRSSVASTDADYFEMQEESPPNITTSSVQYPTVASTIDDARPLVAVLNILAVWELDVFFRNTTSAAMHMRVQHHGSGPSGNRAGWCWCWCCKRNAVLGPSVVNRSELIRLKNLMFKTSGGRS